MDTGTLPLRHLGTIVYRAYDRHGALLYVGISDNLVRRLATHQQRSPWWSEAQTLEWEEHPTRGAALRAEMRLIRRHRPPYNTQGRHGWYVQLRADDTHEPGCAVQLRREYAARAPGDRLSA